MNRLKIKTSFKASDDKWDFKRGQYRSLIRGSLELNNELNDLALKVLKSFNKLKEEEKFIREEDWNNANFLAKQLQHLVHFIEAKGFFALLQITEKPKSHTGFCANSGWVRLVAFLFSLTNSLRCIYYTFPGINIL